MAKIEMTCEATEYAPALVEVIEVRAWGLAGTADQCFNIGSGTNFSAEGNIWLEILQTINGAQIFYTRNFLHYMGNANSAPDEEARLQRFEQGELDRFGFGDMLPETSVILKRDKYTFKNADGEDEVSYSYKLMISADVGVVFSDEPPGRQEIEIRVDDISLEDGMRFMREMIQEINAAYQGQHPDPGSLTPGSSEWPFIHQLNRQAYNSLSASYQETYFKNPLLAQAFDDWLAKLPPGGHVLDAGCGHGDPVITRLIEKGFRVTGTDFSPEMLRRAREQFPQVMLIHQAVTEIDAEAAFDGVCSFSSVLYLDPIDLYNSIYRLHRALKPGGLLFLYAYDLHPSWRGLPFDTQIRRWMWSWSYGMDEAARALEEHGYFQVLETQNVLTEEENQKRIERWRERQVKEYAEFNQTLPTETQLKLPDLTKAPANLAYPYLVAAKRLEREDPQKP